MLENIQCKGLECGRIRMNFRGTKFTERKYPKRVRNLERWSA